MSAELEPEMYAWYVTNEFNFEKLANPPSFEPTLCEGCGNRIVLPEGGYTLAKGKYWCERCEPSPPPRRQPLNRPRRGGVNSQLPSRTAAFPHSKLSYHPVAVPTTELRGR